MRSRTEIHKPRQTGDQMALYGRPRFDALWQQFKKVQGDGTLNHVGKFLGGKVGQNIASGAFENGCAIRMSYALNSSGVDVSHAQGKRVSGADKRQYLFRVSDMHAFLIGAFGPADESVENPTLGSFLGMRGIVLFEVRGWSNATGHVTLWDGQAAIDCSDHCYFDKASRAHLWILP